MPEADKLPPLREVITAHGLSAKKSLGQNLEHHFDREQTAEYDVTVLEYQRIRRRLS